MFRTEGISLTSHGRCVTVGWELVYGFVYPISLGESVAFLPFVFVNWLIIYTTVKFSPDEWRLVPLIQRHLSLVLAAGITVMGLVHWAFVKYCTTPDIAVLWSGFLCQALLGFGSIAQLMSRDSTRGHSFGIGKFRVTSNQGARLSDELGSVVGLVPYLPFSYFVGAIIFTLLTILLSERPLLWCYSS